MENLGRKNRMTKYYNKDRSMTSLKFITAILTQDKSDACIFTFCMDENV